MDLNKTYDELTGEIKELRLQLEEANEIIDAIRTGQIDALVVHGKKGHQLYTLKTADQTYRVFIEKMTEGAVTLNKEGIILYSNSQFATMVNMPLSKVIGLSFHTFISSACKEQFEALLERGWREDCKEEIVLLSKDRLIDFQLSLTTLELDEGVSLSIILTDLTKQKESQRQLKLNNQKLEEINHALELSNHDLQQFAYVASHDLQEPLRKIQVFSSLLKENHSEELSDSSKKYLQKIISSSERMKALIIDILSYSRLSDVSNYYDLTDLGKIINELLVDFEVMIDEKKAAIIIENLPTIEVNPGQIRQVFQNIINNALKFSKPNVSPVIKITAKLLAENSFDSEESTDGPYCCICIEDNGIGFSQKYEESVFTLFQRLNTQDKFEGTGIGLAISKKIIEKHNGQIKASSKEGEGAKFYIILPVSQKPLP